jgi:glycosyltransferase involved in cell wall biosynthesis
MDYGLVSVIIPTYNRSRIVRSAIDSVLAQDYPEIEVLVIDDGSADDTREMMARTYGDNPRVRFFPKSNGGVSSARNLGIRECRGEFIAFLDADDTWLPGKLTRQRECLRRFPEAGMVWTDMAAVDDRNTVIHERYLRKMYSAYQYCPTSRELFAKGLRETRIEDADAFCGDIFSFMVLGNLVHTSTVLLRRERLTRVGFFNERFRTGEDYPFHLKCCGEGPVAYLDTVTIRYAIGLADALTSHTSLELRRQMSLNFLSTLEKTLTRERARISLPPEIIRDCLADAYAWNGGTHLRVGMVTEARAFFMRSLKANPSDPSRIWALLLAWLPDAVRTRLGAARRWLRKRI